MKLRAKTLLIIGLTLTGLVSVLYATASSILLKHIRDIEVDYVQRGVQRGEDALSEDLDELKLPLRQLAAWDDTYDFIQDKNDRYLKSNLSNQTFSDYRLNIILLFDSAGRPVFSQSFDLKQNKKIPTPKTLQQHLVSNSVLLRHSNTKNTHKGIILLPEGPLLVASHPIVTNKFKGPIRGTMLVGRYLNDREIQRLAKLTQLSLSIHPFNHPKLPAELQTARSAFLEGKKNNEETALSTQPQNAALTNIKVQPLNANTIAGYSLIKDIYGKPALILESRFPRLIYKQGQISLGYLLFSLLGVGFVFGIATLLLLEKLVLYRLTRLSSRVKKIGKKGDLSMRVSSKGNDEISSLASNINWMLEALETTLKELKIEREKAERLLLNILPETIANRLKKDPSNIAENFAEATVLFADIVGFTKMASQMSPVELVNLLNKIFSAFDRLVEKHGLEKIKTIGDAYMVVGGLPIPSAEHGEAVAEMALDMLKEIQRFNLEHNVDFSMRIGINTGPVVAGVIGIKKFIYDLWGDTVNVASRMESHGVSGCIQVSEETYKCLKGKYEFEERGAIQVKGRGEMIAYLLLGKKS